jgi:hypothetical protein
MVADYAPWELHTSDLLYEGVSECPSELSLSDQGPDPCLLAVATVRGGRSAGLPC